MAKTLKLHWSFNKPSHGWHSGFCLLYTVCGTFTRRLLLHHWVCIWLLWLPWGSDWVAVGETQRISSHRFLSWLCFKIMHIYSRQFDCHFFLFCSFWKKIERQLSAVSATHFYSCHKTKTSFSVLQIKTKDTQIFYSCLQDNQKSSERMKFEPFRF